MVEDKLGIVKKISYFFFNFAPKAILCPRRPYIFWSIYSPVGAEIEKSSEKDFNGRISCRTKAQSIPGASIPGASGHTQILRYSDTQILRYSDTQMALGHKMALGPN